MMDVHLLVIVGLIPLATTLVMWATAKLLAQSRKLFIGAVTVWSVSGSCCLTFVVANPPGQFSWLSLALIGMLAAWYVCSHAMFRKLNKLS